MLIQWKEIDTRPLLKAYPVPDHSNVEWPTEHMALSKWIEAGRAWRTMGYLGAVESIEMSLREEAL